MGQDAVAAGHASLTRKALRLAAQNGQRAVLELLLERGVPSDAADGDLSSLGAAARAGQALLVDLLVARGADVVRHGTAALLFALERSAPGAEALLAHLSAPLSPEQSRQAIALAKELGNRPLIASVKRLWHLVLVLHGNLGAFEPERHPSLTEGAGVEIDGAPLTEPRRLEPGVELQVRADEPGHGGHVGPAGGVMVFGMGPPLRRPPVGHPLSPASADPFSAPC